MSAPSQTDIINIALGHLKQRKIANTTESSVQASEALRYYDIARRETLRSGPWSFNKCIKSLALNASYAISTSGVYAGKWLYAYTYPSNALSIARIFSETTTDAKEQREEFTIVYDDTNNSKVILTDCYQALCEYAFDVQDTTMFDASFIPAFALRLAFDMAPNLTGDDGVAGDILKMYNIAISEADRVDSYEEYDKSQDKTTSPYEETR